MDSPKNKIDAAIVAFGEAKFREGLIQGLYELRTFVAWMTQQPDTKRQAETRGWMERRIQEYIKKNGLEGQ